MGDISNIGWIVLAFVAVLIFIVIMLRGGSFKLGDKELTIGKLNKKMDDSFEDEELRKILFKKSIGIDEHLNADLRRSVRRLDSKICAMLEPAFSSFLLIMGLASIIKDELNERIDYNNIKEKLSSSERQDYLFDIIKDIKNAFSTFTLALQKQNKNEQMPEWSSIATDILQLVSDWEKDVVSLLIKHIEQKITMYEQSKDKFKTAEYIKSSITYPLEKNKKYLKDLRG